MIEGLDTRELAAQLFISRHTVQDHLKSVFDKVGVRSRPELVSGVFAQTAKSGPRRGIPSAYPATTTRAPTAS